MSPQTTPKTAPLDQALSPKIAHISLRAENQETRNSTSPDFELDVAEIAPSQTPDAQDDHVTKRTDALLKFLDAPFNQIEPYRSYVSGQAAFDTHQDVKGLEFDRVMVIVDDDEARGFMFKYDKLFGAKAPSATDKKKQESGEETGLDRTRRLLYVTCSRAEKSLALVVYTDDPNAVKAHVLANGWFTNDEIDM